ncbi:MAG: helicase C-terminal domain-containing protein [Microbacteriaceae bacterium]
MDYFSKGGPLNRRLGSAYRVREQQQTLATTLSGLKPGDSLAAAAPVAIGKGDACGVAILQSNMRGVVSTYSRTLLDQLEAASKEWQQDFPDKKIVVMRGRNNFVCQRKLDALRGDKRHLPIVQWGEENTLLRGGPEGVQKISGSGCTGRGACDFGKTCHYYKTRDDCATAHLVLCTHAMVFANCDYPSSDEEGRPRYWLPRGIWVADEGDKLAEALGDDLGISGYAFQALMEDIGVVDGLKTQLQKLSDWAKEACNGPYPSVNIEPKDWMPWVEATLPQLESARNQYVKYVSLEEDADKPLTVETLAKLSGMLAAMQESQPTNGFAVSWQKPKRYNKGEDLRCLSLQRRPTSLGGALQRYVDVFQRFAAVSGSMTLPGSGFDFVKKLSGIKFTSELSLPSPIKYRDNLKIVIEHTQELERFCELAVKLHLEGGPVLILTPRYSTVRAVKEAFEAAGLSKQLLAQEQDSVDTVDALAQKLRGGMHASIVGTLSAWVGLDLDARYKRAVLIEKFPTPSPTQDLALHGYMLRYGRNAAYNMYGTPQALKLAVQGVGRTLRRETDKCLLVICDRLIDTRGAIPGGQYTSLDEGIEWISRELPKKVAASSMSSTVSDDFAYLLEGI